MKKHSLNISQKNFLYNLILTLLICVIIFSYMIFYMPNVYLEKKIESYEKDALAVHNFFVKNKSYNKDDGIMNMGMYSYYVPYGENTIKLSGQRFNSSVTVKNKELINFLRYMEKDDFEKFDWKEFENLTKPIIYDFKKEFNRLFEINNLDKIKIESNDTLSVKNIDGTFLLNFKMSSDESVAANLVLISKDDAGIYVSIYPYIFQSIGDIKSTVFSAIPVIFLLVVLIVFLVNRIYSKSITDPIIEMSNFTRRSKNEKNAKYDLKINTHDELEELSNNLKELYETLTENYNNLEKSTKKREIFVRATSHELKTPLQTAILLNESMINKIGKYKDTDRYLPELREKLSKIQVLIDDLLFMNRIDESPIYEDLDLSLILKESIENHDNLISEKKLDVEVNGNLVDLVDYDHFRIIFDNLIKNAIENTDYGGKIISNFGDDINITNYPTEIKEKNLEGLFDPFVSGSIKKSSGLGLYIAKNLLEDMKYDIKLSYKDNKFSVNIKKKLK